MAPRDPAVRHIGRLMLPGVAGLAVTQVNVFVGMLLASFQVQGSVAALGYAFRLVQFPIGVVGVSVATGALPVMAAAMARDAVEEMKRVLQDSLRLAVFFALPSMVGLILFRIPILVVLFQRGAFTRAATALTASILLAYALGLTFYIANRILAPAFYAMHDTWTPVSTGMVSVAVNILASLLLMGPLGTAGLALATAVASACNCLQLSLRLRRRIGRLGTRRLLHAAGRAGLACLPMAAWGVLAEHWLGSLPATGALIKALLLGGELAVAVALFSVTARFLGCEELGWTLDLLRRRRHKPFPA
ncbi:MAG TPA: lipid II flippase MurJ, partial [Candidatus Sulfotelmatobacter sp.]|nr:lipid II flippase MurJ [Candidatus Sulfotelmatobacter sp.]